MESKNIYLVPIAIMYLIFFIVLVALDGLGKVGYVFLGGCIGVISCIITLSLIKSLTL